MSIFVHQANDNEASKQAVNDYNLSYVRGRNGLIAMKTKIELADDPQTATDDLRTAHALSVQDMAIAKLDMKMNLFLFGQLAIQPPAAATVQAIADAADALANLTVDANTADQSVTFAMALLGAFSQIHGA